MLPSLSTLMFWSCAATEPFWEIDEVEDGVANPLRNALPRGSTRSQDKLDAAAPLTHVGVTNARSATAPPFTAFN